MTLKENPMTARLINTSAPDFTLTDIQGRTVRLSDYRGKANIVLVFNRGVL
jgi:peroxiredoxin